MALSSTFSGIKKFVKLNFIARITGVMMKGSLGQKVTVVVGGVFIVLGISRAFQWILLASAGYLLIFLAFKDYDRLKATGSGDPH